jgi:hypothetical protein
VNERESPTFPDGGPMPAKHRVTAIEIRQELKRRGAPTEGNKETVYYRLRALVLGLPQVSNEGEDADKVRCLSSTTPFLMCRALSLSYLGNMQPSWRASHFRSISKLLFGGSRSLPSPIAFSRCNLCQQAHKCGVLCLPEECAKHVPMPRMCQPIIRWHAANLCIPVSTFFWSISRHV